MAELINLPTIAPYNLPVNLDGKSYNLKLSWNTRDNCWSLTVSESGIEIEGGIKIVPRQPLVVFGRSDWSLDGNLFVLSTASSVSSGSLSRDNFGGTRDYQMYYVPTDEEDAFFATR